MNTTRIIKVFLASGEELAEERIFEPADLWKFLGL